jgi:hypothetical protein
LTADPTAGILFALANPSLRLIVRVCFVATFALALPAAVQAQSACDFSRSGSVMQLTRDCITESSVVIPDGWTLDGNTHSITAVDPPGGVFEGPIVVARGRTASIIRTRVTASLRSNFCADGEARLRGIYFDGASGEIGSNTVDEIHRVASSCEEGNAIEVRNRATEGPATTVTISGNYIDRYQKSGIVVHGRVQALIQWNFVGSSVSSGMLGPNAVQVGPVAGARIERNQISGVFAGTSAAGGSAILLMSSGAGTVVEANDVTGDADVGINVVADQATITNNRLVDTDDDDRNDVGIVNFGLDNSYINNTIVGFRTRQYGVEEGSSTNRRGQQIE